jgi:O-antigen/teichoic acid export membrane protein
MVSSDTLALIYGQIVVVILSASFGYEEVGIFRSALNIIVYSFIVPSLIFAVGLPVLSRITCKEDFRRFAIFLLILAVFYGLCFILFSMMFGSTFIDIIYGSFHAMVLHLIHSMSIVVLLKSINMISAAILIVTNRIKYRVAVQFVVVVFSVLAGTALIPTYGVDAAIFLTIAIECILLFGYGFFALKSLLDV